MAKEKSAEAYDFGKFEQDTLTKPRDKAWQNWAKFEKEGDSVQGYIRDVFYRKEEGEFKAQRGITLEQQNGELINVGIKRIPFILQKTDTLRLNDPLTIVFEKSLEPKQKGYKGAKQFAFYGKNLEANLSNPTVLQLDEEDMARGGTTGERVEGDDEAEEDFKKF